MWMTYDYRNQNYWKYMRVFDVQMQHLGFVNNSFVSSCNNNNSIIHNNCSYLPRFFKETLLWYFLQREWNFNCLDKWKEMKPIRDVLRLMILKLWSSRYVCFLLTSLLTYWLLRCRLLNVILLVDPLFVQRVLVQSFPSNPNLFWPNLI